MQKNIFVVVNASLHWLNNLSGVNLIQFSLLLIGQQGLGHFIRYWPLLLTGWRTCANFKPTPEKKKTNTAPTTHSEVQASSQSTFINEQLYSTCD
jgi:hypothetical protein